MTMGSHQRAVGTSQQHLTPRWILDPLGPFDLDPCASSPRPWDCAAVNWTKQQDGLARQWFDRVWCNPPFHRYLIHGWLRAMGEHNRGIALTHVRTDTDWFKIVRESATGLFFLDRRVVFLDEKGRPQTIKKRTSKYFGKVANSGAPVMLAAYGADNADRLAALPLTSDEPETLAGWFVPLIVPRSVIVEAIRDKSWRDLVTDFLAGTGAAIRVADLYRAFAEHPKAKGNPNWKAKLRQTLQRGAGKSVGRDQWVAT